MILGHAFCGEAQPAQHFVRIRMQEARGKARASATGLVALVVDKIVGSNFLMARQVAGCLLLGNPEPRDETRRFTLSVQKIDSSRNARRLIVTQGSPVVSAVPSVASLEFSSLGFLPTVVASGAAWPPRFCVRVVPSLDSGHFIDILDASSKWMGI